MHFLLIVSALLSLISILLMAVLIASRILAQQREKGRTEARHVVQGALISFASNVDEDELFETLHEVDTDQISEVASELLNLIRGDIAPHLRAVLERLDVPAHERRLLKHGLLPTRLRATEFLAFFPDPLTIKALRSALSDGSQDVRISAAISLANMEVDFDLRAFLLGLQRANVRSKRISELLEVIFRTDRDRVIALLYEDALGDGVKSLLIDGICRTKASDLAELLAELINAPKSSEFAATVIRSSAILGHAQSLAMIVEHLESPDPELVLAAVDGAKLLGIPDDRVISALGQLLETSPWVLRHAASTALQTLGSKGRDELLKSSRMPELTAVSTAGLRTLEPAYV